MNIRELAIADHKAILSDVDAGFAQLLTITNPAGVSFTLAGYASDVGEVVDPQTNLVIEGRRATVTFNKAPLVENGMGTPAVIASGKQRPWTVSFVDAGSVVRVYKIASVIPDNHIDNVRCELEGLKE